MPTQIELLRELSVDSNSWHEKYPWFSLGQLINVYNKRQLDIYQSAAQLTAIYFNDVQRLHWLINEQVFNKNKILNDLMVPIIAEGMQSTPQPFPKRDHLQEITAPDHLLAIAAVEETDAIGANSIEPKEDNLVESKIIASDIENLGEKDLHENTIGNATNLVDETEKQPEHSNVYTQQPEKIIVAEQIDNNNGSPAEKIKFLEEATAALITNEEIKETIEGENLTKEKSTATADGFASVTKSEENIKAVLDGGDAMHISFEPYHTIDYFASQGIKVDIKTDDRLGKQLKSFTSWLKSMKRLPMTEEIVTDAQKDQPQDKSLEETNVITEAMAAVLLKQGKKDQAIAIFRKLSLLHPEKSRYFAAQIEQIKN